MSSTIREVRGDAAPVAPPCNTVAPPSNTIAPHNSLATWWLGVILFTAVAALVLTLTLEWEHYRKLLTTRQAPLSHGDRAIVLWLLWTKSVAPLVPLLAAAGLLASTGRQRIATGLFGLGATVLFFWLAVDLVVQRITGNHVFDFLPHLQDALNSTDRNHLEWAGDNASIVWRALLVLGVVAALGVGILRGCHWLAERAVRRSSWLGGRWATLGCTLAFFIAGVAAVPAQVFFSQPILLRRLHTAMPVDLALFVPQATHPQVYAQLIGRTMSEAPAPGVRIVSLLPDPAGVDEGNEQATLHNFSQQPIPLDGWLLRNRNGNEFALSDTLAAGQTLCIALPAGKLPLNNDGDEVRLIDVRGRERHKVQYKGDYVKYGGVLAFREESDLDEFLHKTNQGVQAVYRNLREDVLTARPVDEQARVDAPSPPNVVYLVLESFRHSAISPELMSRLDAWGQQGLRLNRHYAGSNSSHLGLFTLLYGRSPLVYNPTVDAGVPPQTAYTLRKSGYECSFLTSGDCTNFRKMDRFLNDQQFDRLIIENGADWHDWPERDSKTLAHARRILHTNNGKPQFVMAFLMSTHFPYAFPPDFDKHQPSGADVVTRSNWREMDTEVLYNRYRNAALSLEAGLMQLIESLDPAKNLIVVTGDHGESMAEDGALAHASRGSEIQTRVPMLVIGPGVRPQVIEQPTTHTDVLPTLLHMLSGQSIAVEHGHGRDLLAADPLGDQVMVCPYRWKDPYDLILMRGAQRMQFKIRLDKATVEAYGFCDTSGNLDLNEGSTLTERDAPIWVEAFRKELLRIAR